MCSPRKTKEFNCVRMKKKGARAVLEELEKLTPEQQLEYWKRQTEELKRWAAEAKSAEANRRFE